MTEKLLLVDEEVRANESYLSFGRKRCQEIDDE